MKNKIFELTKNKSISEIFEVILANKQVRELLADSLELEELFEQKDNKVNEEIMLQVIREALVNKEVYNVFVDSLFYITIANNITDKVFEELLIFAEKTNCKKVYLALCHATLKPEHANYLKSLNLDSSYYY